MSGTLELFCWVQGDPHDQAFSLEIAGTKTVSALKKAIKAEKKPAFDHVPADTLKLWKVSASYQDEPVPLRADAGNAPLAGQCQVQSERRRWRSSRTSQAQGRYRRRSGIESIGATQERDP
jgi:hypothetical protein